jgi:hypothetical protein
MKALRPVDGQNRVNQSDYIRCQLVLHPPPKPLATHLVTMYQNSLARKQVMYVCEECAEERLDRYREEFPNVQVKKVGIQPTTSTYTLTSPL